MKKILFFFFLLSLTIQPIAAYSQERIPNDQEEFFQKAMAQINPKHVRWIKSTAIDVNKNNLDEPAVMGLAKTYLNFGAIGDADIMAIAFLVMMEAAKSAREDLKVIMAGVKNLNEQKKSIREANDKLNRNTGMVSRIQLDSFKLLLVQQPIKNSRIRKNNNDVPVTQVEINETKLQLKNKLDSLNEMGEMESLRLQMAMDRMSKMMSTLSNILKKISQTANQIIQNLK